MVELGRDFFQAKPPLALGFPDRIDFAQHRPFTGPFSGGGGGFSVGFRLPRAFGEIGRPVRSFKRPLTNCLRRPKGSAF